MPSYSVVEPLLDLQLGRAVEDRRREVETERVRGPPEVRLENLPHVHARWHAERVQHDLDRRPVRQVRHVLLGEDARDDALVAVAAGHLVADRQLALHRHVHLYELYDARRQLVAAADLLLLLLEQLADYLHLPLGPSLEGSQILLEGRIVSIELRAHELLIGEHLQHLLGERRPLAEQALAAEVVEQIGPQRLALQHLDHALLHLVVKDADLVLQVLLHHVELVMLDRLRPVVLLDPLPREDLHADDDSLDARGADEGGVADVAGLLAEERAQQLLFRRELRFALRRDLAHEDVARLHVGADADDPALVEIAQVGLRDVRDVPGDLLGPELRVARLDLELLDVDRRVVVVLHHAFGHEDRVFEVVAAPRHEGDEHVAAERQLPQLRAGPVAEHLALVDLLADADDRPLVDARVLVRALELREVVDVGAHLLADAFLLTFHAHHD